MLNRVILFFVIAGLMASGCGKKEEMPERKFGYAGSRSCKECHERFYNLWEPSHHGKAMQPYNDKFAAGLSNQVEAIKIGDVSYIADISKGKGYMKETGPRGSKVYPIEHVMGGKNVYFFLTPMERGRLQVMPLSYNVETDDWYDTTASMVRHFNLEEDEALHWTDSLLTFNTACYNCHVSQLEKNYDLETDTYKTVWLEPGINCEACHGPSEEHNAVCREAMKKGERPEDLKIILWDKLSVEQKNTACNVCHAKASRLTDNFKPGDRFFDHFDLTAYEDRDFYPDGRDLGENYTMNSWMMSPCVKAGKLDCIHCHTSSGRYRFAKENPNGACLPCHEKRVADIKKHSHHEHDQKGSPTCVSCHMPMTTFGRMDRSDHSMRGPSPEATLEFKSPNACNICHKKKPAKWAVYHLNKWHPKGRPGSERIVREGRLVKAARDGKWEILPDVLKYIQEKDADDMVVTSLVRLLYPCRDFRKIPVLKEMLKHKSPLVRSAAVSSLGAYDIDSVRAVLPLLDDDYRLVRIRAASVLQAYRRELLPLEDRQKLEKVEKELLASMNCRPDHWSSHYNLGNYWGQRGELERAVKSYKLAMKMRPDVMLAYVNASIAVSQLGRNEEAYQYLMKAYEVDPKNGAVNMNLGLLMAERGEMEKAEKYLRAAMQDENVLPQAAYNLAVIVGKTKPAEAVELCRKALKAMPGNQKYRQALMYYKQKLKHN